MTGREVRDELETRVAERTDELHSSETELRQILDLTPQLIAVYGPNRERLYANRVFLDYIGFNLEQWRQSLGRGNFLHPDEIEQISSFFDHAIARGSAGELECRLRRRDGSYRWFLARFNPLCDEHGYITRWYVAATDIQDRKQAEEDLRRLSGQLLHSQDEERRRIARDLHDSTGQDLVALATTLGQLHDSISCG